MSCGEWRGVDAVPALEPACVQVWRIDLGAADYAEHLALLTEDERARANAFRFARDRQRFVVARGTLRRLLASHAGRAPESLRFETGAAGKPFLRAQSGGPDIRFNISHAGEVGLFAFACDVEVGVDVEQCRTNVEPLNLAKRFFAPEEAAAIEQARLPEERLDVFYTCWSRKEAVLKATGEGLRLELDSFVAGGCADLRTLRIPVPGAERHYDVTLYPVPQVDGYRAALATLGAGRLRREFFIGRAA